MCPRLRLEALVGPRVSAAGPHPCSSQTSIGLTGSPWLKGTTFTHPEHEIKDLQSLEKQALYGLWPAHQPRCGPRFLKRPLVVRILRRPWV